MLRKYIPGSLLLLMVFASLSYAQQPLMTAARADLLQARAQLNSARHNKGGHRVKAIGYINSAIAEVNAGIRFDRRNNHAQLNFGKVSGFLAAADQPHMQRALDNLRQAKNNLERATSDKGGHRRKAIGYVDSAIDEVKKGIDAGE
ncbi:MAG TPA: hypothetical protein VNO50_03500 [Pyrinomonadaceae bacterium]|nr:hypothetical protein [Pyrinomonadaceae bacterium]